MIVKCPEGHDNRIPDDSPPQTAYRCPRCKKPIEIVWPSSDSRTQSSRDFATDTPGPGRAEGGQHISKVPGIVSIVLLLLGALGDWRGNRGFYTLLRFGVRGSSVYLAWGAGVLNKSFWVWVMGACAVLFNPLIPIWLARPLWQAMDIVAAGIFAVAILAIRGRGQKAV